MPRDASFRWGGSEYSTVGGVVSLHSARKGSVLAAGSADGMVRVWDHASQALLWECATGATDPGLPRHVVLSPDGRLLAACTLDTLLVWRLSPHERRLGPADAIFLATGWFPDACFASDGKAVWWLDSSGGVRRAGLVPWAKAEDVNFPGVAAARTLALSPDGTRLALGGRSGEVLLFDPAGKKLLRRFGPGHDGAVHSIGFTPEGHVFTGSADGTARTWSTATGRELLRLGGHVRGCQSITVSPSGRLIVTGDRRGEVRAWDARTGKLLATTTPCPSGVTGLAFVLGSDEVAVGGECEAVRFYSAPKLRERHVVGAHRGALRRVSFSPDGRSIAFAGADGFVSTWSLPGHTLQRAMPTTGWPLNALAWSSDGLIAAGGFDGALHAWDARSGKQVASWKAARRLHEALFLPVAGQMACTSGPPVVSVREVKTGVAVREVKMHHDVVAAALVPGKSVLLLKTVGRLTAWDAASGKTLWQVEDRGELPAVLSMPSLAASGDGAWCAYTQNAAEGQTVWLHDTASGKNLQVARFKDLDKESPLAFVGASRLLAMALSDGRVQLYDWKRGVVVKTYTAGAGRVLDIAAAPDGKSIISTHADSTAYHWRIP